MEEEAFLNGGLYRNTCQRLNISVGNVMKNFMDGSVKIGNFVRMNVDSKCYSEKLPKKGKLVKCLIVNFAKKNFMFQGGEQNLIGENIAHKNVIGKIGLKNIQTKEIHNTSTGELKNIQKHFIIQSNGEILEKKSTKEIIGLVRFAGKVEGNYMPIILFRSENARTHSENQILSPCVESATYNSIVLNNRTGGENEFYT